MIYRTAQIALEISVEIIRKYVYFVMHHFDVLSIVVFIISRTANNVIESLHFDSVRQNPRLFCFSDTQVINIYVNVFHSFPHAYEYNNIILHHYRLAGQQKNRK